jgi:hypothetical protein
MKPNYDNEKETPCTVKSRGRKGIAFTETLHFLRYSTNQNGSMNYLPSPVLGCSGSAQQAHSISSIGLLELALLLLPSIFQPAPPFLPQHSF